MPTVDVGMNEGCFTLDHSCERIFEPETSFIWTRGYKTSAIASCRRWSLVVSRFREGDKEGHFVGQGS